MQEQQTKRLRSGTNSKIAGKRRGRVAVDGGRRWVEVKVPRQYPGISEGLEQPRSDNHPTGK